MEERNQTTLLTYPRPNEPCRLCSNTSLRNGYLRFLNAAVGVPFVIFVDDGMVSNALACAELSDYATIATGRHVVTLMGENGSIYLQKPIELMDNVYATIAILITGNTLDLQIISDSGRSLENDMACIRVANLMPDSGTLTVTLGNRYLNVNNLRFRDVSAYEPVWADTYLYTISRSAMAHLPGLGEVPLWSATLTLPQNSCCTIVLMRWNANADSPLRVLLISEPCRDNS